MAKNPICSCINLSPKPKRKCDSNCIYAPDLLVNDQVSACDGITDIDISPVIAACDDNEVYYTIISSKNITGNATITANKITFTPMNNNYMPSEIIYKVSCGMLSASGKVIIIYKNNCIGKVCPDNKYCDKCTGNCLDKTSDGSVIPDEIIPPTNDSGFI